MEIVAKQTKLTMMQQLEDIIVDVSWGRLSQEYVLKNKYKINYQYNEKRNLLSSFFITVKLAFTTT